jgi:hypothetical protein
LSGHGVAAGLAAGRPTGWQDNYWRPAARP